MFLIKDRYARFVVRIVIAAALVAWGLLGHAPLVAVVGVALVVWGAFNFFNTPQRRAQAARRSAGAGR